MLKKFRCDLHIHTCLSPCAELDMYPTALIKKSISEHLDMIAICDHNASENVQYVMKVAEGKPIVVIPGMEITSREEVHTLALFDNIENLYQLQEVVYRSLSGMNREELFGCQAIVNEHDEVEGFNDRRLIGATKLSLHDIVETIHFLNGLAIAAHIDRESFSVLGQLGFIPEDIYFDALEISRRTGLRKAREIYSAFSSYPMIESSDAHVIEDIGKGSSIISMNEPTVAELKKHFKRYKDHVIREC